MTDRRKSPLFCLRELQIIIEDHGLGANVKLRVEGLELRSGVRSIKITTLIII
jgi:hypothetical protein